MSKIYLDKLCNFALTTYNNYEHINKNFDFNDYINNIKQNHSLNEKGIFLKHNFIELKMLIPEIEYEQMVLINPLCFNLNENIEWFNFLNGLLTVLNDNYLHESNLIKKTILETVDKTYRKKINLLNCFDDKIINSVCTLTNITLILLNEQNKIKLFNYNNKINKIVIMVNFEKEYFSLLNWNQKYYDLNSQFTKYLIDKYNNMELNKKNEIQNPNPDPDPDPDSNPDSNSDSKPDSNQEFTVVINKKKKINIGSNYINEKKIKKSSKLNNNNMFDFNSDIEDIPNNDTNNITNNIQSNTNIAKELNKDTYKELQADENYAIYISEVIDNNTVNKKENIYIDKKKKKNNKNIFVTNKEEQEINKTDKIITKDGIEEFNEQGSSVFNKTEKITKKEIEKICNEVKITMGLETIQSNALKLGINIFEGSTKSGKPKNKTKSELIDKIREFAKNI